MTAAELWDRHAAGEDLSAAEAAALAAALEGDPAFRRACLDDQALRGGIGLALRQRQETDAGAAFARAVLERLRAAGTTTDFVERVVARLPTDRRAQPGSWRSGRPRRSRPPRWRSSAIASGAAAAVLALVLLSVLGDGPPDPGPATVVAIDGRALQADRPLAIGSLVTADRPVAVAADSELVLAIRDHRIRLAGGSRLTIDRPVDAGTSLRLDAGRVTCRVASLDTGSDFRVVGPHASCIVEGTVFTVAVDERRTALRVDEGRVHMRLPDGASRVITAGARATADAMGFRDPPLLPLAAWDFAGEGTTITNRGGDRQLDFLITDPTAARRTAAGLVLSGGPAVRSRAPAAGLLTAIRSAGGFTLDLVCTPAAATPDFDTTTIGPARILTWSAGSLQRNCTLGQGAMHRDGSGFSLRLRRSVGTPRACNGLPVITAAEQEMTTITRLTVVVDAARGCRLYRHGVLAAEDDQPIDLASWDPGYHLGLGAELQIDDDRGYRSWHGTIHALAIYEGALETEAVVALPPP